MALIPGMPMLPFIIVGALADPRRAAHQGQPKAKAGSRRGGADRRRRRAPETETTEDLIEQMRVHALEILLAPDLVDIVSGASDDLLARVRALRRKIAMELGIVVPPVRTRDSVDLPPVHLRRSASPGSRPAAASRPRGKVLALGDAPRLAARAPRPSSRCSGWPASGSRAEMRHSAEMTGATVIDRVSVLVTHLSSIITANAARLLTREDVRVLTEGVKQVNPSAVEELVPGAALAGRGAARAAGPARRAGADQRPAAHLRGAARCAPRSVDRPRGPHRGGPAARSGPAIAASYLDGSTLRVDHDRPGPGAGACSRGCARRRPARQIMLDAAQHRGGARLGASSRSAQLEAHGQSAVLVCAPALRPAIRRLVCAADRRPPGALLPGGHRRRRSRSRPWGWCAVPSDFGLRARA